MSVRLALCGLLAVFWWGCQDPEEASPPKPPPEAKPTPTPEAPQAPAVTNPIIVGQPTAPEAVPEPPQVTLEDAGKPLDIAVAGPRGEVKYNLRPVITFTRPVRPLGVRDMAPPARIEPSLEGTWRWHGSTTAEFHPKGPVPRSTTYTVTVPKGLRAVDGGVLEEDYSYTFSTARIRPLNGKPVSSWHAFKWVKPDEAFTVVFDQMPDAKTLQGNVQFTSDGGLTTGVVVKSVGPVPKEKDESERIDEDDRRGQAVFAPAAPLPKGRNWQLVFGAGLGSTEGPLPLGKPVAWKFSTYGDMAVESVGCSKWHGTCATGPLTVAFTNPVTKDALAAALTVEPAVDLRWEDAEDRAQWYVQGAFKPATTYTVHIRGLKDVFGQALPDGSHTFQTGDLEPYLRAPEDQALLEAKGRAALPLTYVNQPGIQVGTARMGVMTAVRYLREPWTKAEPPGMTWNPMPLQGERNQRSREPLDLGPLMEQPGEGKVALVRLKWGDNPKRPRTASTVVQVTDLGVHTKISPNDAFVWVWRLSDGASVKGATVRIRDREGQVLAVATTDADGVAQLPGVDQLEYAGKKPNQSNWGPPFLVAEVSDGGDVALVEMGDDYSLAAYRFGARSSWDDAPPRAAGMVFTDRDIYRPGETVYVKGILRERRSGKLKTPAGRALTLNAYDADNNVFAQHKLTLSEFGGFHVALPLATEGKLGYHRIEIEDPANSLDWSAQFRVAEYRAPSFLVDVKPAQPERFSKQPVQAQVEGRYLFGAAMRGADVRWTVLSAPGEFTPKNPDGYTFGRWVSWWDQDAQDVGVVASGRGSLDDTGGFVVESGPAETLKDAPVNYTVEASVTDVDRQQVSGRATFPVHPAAFYVGLRGPSGFAAVGAPFEVSAVARSATDESRVAAKATIKLNRHTWQTVRKKNALGQFETVSEKMVEEVGSCAVDIAADAAAKCSLEPSAAGYHELVAEAQDAAGRATTTTDPLWVVGMGYAAWLTDGDNKIEVVSDKVEYDVGDTARLLVQSPFPKAEAWVTVEREGVLWRKRMRLEGTATPIEIPITEAFIPNVFVSVVLARPRTAEGGVPGDPGRPTFRMGYRELRVVKARKRLALELKPDALEMRPGDDLNIGVTVQDHAGQGVAAEVTVWAVDKGVLALTGYQTPDPMEALFARRGTSVRNATNLNRLVAQLDYGEKGRPPGGGGGDEGGDDMGLRKKFVTTPIFVGDAQTDPSGKATVRGKLPDNLTTFRLMAVAVDKGDRGGKAELDLVVNKPLMARPALPRAARVDDRFLAGVVLHTQDDKPTKVRVTAAAEGPVEALEGDTQEVTVPPGKGLEVRFPFKAAGIGPAKLRFVAIGGGHQDAVEMTVPVREPARLETLAVYGDTVTEIEEQLAKPGEMRTDMGGLSVTLASTVLAGLTQDAEALVGYPYGCLEQRTSRLVPLVVFKDLIEAQGGAVVSRRPIEEVVAENVRAIAALQRPDGGFGYWPGASRSHYWATGYAALALGEVRGAGYDLGTIDLDRAHVYLRDTWRGEPGTPWPRYKESQALALYVLSQAGRPEAGLEAELYRDREKLAPFGKALLASALARPGPPMERARGLVDGLLNEAQVDGDVVRIGDTGEESFARIFHSGTRTDSLALQALLETRPDHVYAPRMARGIMEGRRGGRGFVNTQAAGFAMLALRDYTAAKEGTPPNFEAQVKLAEKVVASARFQGRSLSREQAEVPMSDLPVAATSLKFGVVGTGRLYYDARLRFAPVELPTEPLDDGIHVQRWYTPEGGQGQVHAVNEGTLVTVTVRVATPKLRHYVAVEDPLPAGLEPIDATLATSAQAAPEQGEDGPRWYSVFDHVEIRDDRVLLFADRLPPGVHTYTYLARATTAGTFIRPPARAEEMYSPEVSGRSTGGQFWVHPRTELAGR